MQRSFAAIQFYHKPIAALAQVKKKLFGEEYYKQYRKYCGEKISAATFSEKFKHVSTLKKKSLIPDSGNGLFANQNICQETIFGFNLYELANDAVKTRIDTIDDEYLRTDIIEEKVNTRIVIIADNFFLQATKDIKKGEEITRYYGPKYWMRQVLLLQTIRKEININHQIEREISNYLIEREALNTKYRKIYNKLERDTKNFNLKVMYANTLINIL